MSRSVGTSEDDLLEFGKANESKIAGKILLLLMSETIERWTRAIK